MSNPYIKQCEQCEEYFNIKDVKFFPAERIFHKNGTVGEAPDRYYCQPCQDSWALASEGYSNEEWNLMFEEPIRTEQKIEGRWVTLC